MSLSSAPVFEHLLLAHTQALSQGFSNCTTPYSGILTPWMELDHPDFKQGVLVLDLGLSGLLSSAGMKKMGVGTAWPFPVSSEPLVKEQLAHDSTGAATEWFRLLLSLSSLMDNPPVFQMGWSLSGQRRQTAQSSRENSPTRSPSGKLLWPFHFDFSIPVSRSENPGRARGTVTPSQVQHCGQRGREKWVREGHLRGLLCSLGGRSQFLAVSGLGGHSCKEVGTHRFFKYLRLANTFSLSLQL